MGVATQDEHVAAPMVTPGSPRPDTGVLRRFLIASAIGGLAAVGLFGWLLTMGRAELTSWQQYGNFYDEQARAWLDGRWDVPAKTLGIERFEVRGRSYMYQGPFPALLRLPVVALTDRFDGRMTVASMLAGFSVAVGGVIALHWRIRSLLQGVGRPLPRSEAWLTGALTFAATGGSALLFVASRAWVYHEAIIWGTAWALISLAAVLSCLRQPNSRHFVLAAVAAALSLGSRSSVGLGPVVAIALVAVGHSLVWLATRVRKRRAGVGQFLDHFRWLAGDAANRRIRPLVAASAAVAPLAAYAAVNWIKFRTAFSIPFQSQGFTLVDPSRQAMLDANDGSYVGLQFVATTLPQYLRPDAIGLSSAFPFVDFPALAPVQGGAVFDLVDRSTSAPVAMPLLVILALVAVVAMVRPAWGAATAVDSSGLGVLRVPALGALASTALILPFPYIANRYLADMVPFLAVAGLAGAQVLFARSGAWQRRTRSVVVTALVAALVAGTWVNLGLGLIYQRLYSPNADEDVIAAFLDTSFDLPQAIGLDPPIPITQGDTLPGHGERGQLFIVGDCDGLYLSDGMEENSIKITDWNPVERTEATGRWQRHVVFDDVAIGTRQPLVSHTGPGGSGVLWVERRAGDGLVFGWTGDVGRSESPERSVPAGRSYDLDVILDPEVSQVEVHLDGILMYESYAIDVGGGPGFLGVDISGDPTVEDRFTGELLPLPAEQGLCEELRAEAGLE